MQRPSPNREISHVIVVNGAKAYACRVRCDVTMGRIGVCVSLRHGISKSHEARDVYRSTSKPDSLRMVTLRRGQLRAPCSHLPAAGHGPNQLRPMSEGASEVDPVV